MEKKFDVSNYMLQFYMAIDTDKALALLDQI